MAAIALLTRRQWLQRGVFGLARALTPQASTFSLMAVPLVGVVSAAFVVGEVPRGTDWLAALFIAAAIAAATWRRGDNARA